jgi:uncharacterized damage-inducible protein DinB
MTMSEDLRYPTGRFKPRESLTPADRAALFRIYEEVPARMRAAVAGLTDAQLDTPYRDGGWTVRQVVHHVPDSHMNGYIRNCLALTEDTPTIRPYDEDAWSRLHYYRTGDLTVSQTLLDVVHERWLTVWQNMSEADFGRRFNHPESGEQTLDRLLQLYAWHGPHHIAHITTLRERNGWIAGT